MQVIDLSAIFMIAFVGSFGHCIGMCGGFIIAYSAAKIDPSMSKTAQMIRHLSYNFGRVTAYSLMGIVFGATGMLFTASMELHGVLFLMAGILMIITALAMLNISKLLHSIEYSFQKLPIFKRAFSSLIHSQTFGSFFKLGLLNGVFPCGFVYFFAAKATATASPVDGMIVMAVFGLATVPTLAILGQSVGFMRSISFRQTMNRVAAIAILLYGIFTFYYGLAYFFELPI